MTTVIVALAITFAAQCGVVAAIKIGEVETDKKRGETITVTADGKQQQTVPRVSVDPRSAQLFIAVREGNARAARVLLEDHGADINATEPDGTTPLLVAAQNGDVTLVTLLLEKGAGHLARPDGATPLRMACLVALQDKPTTMGLIHLLLEAVVLQTEASSTLHFQTAAEAVGRVISSLVVEPHERGPPPPPTILAAAKVLVTWLPTNDVSAALAAVLCATGSMLKELLFTRCMIAEAAAMLTTLPCVADSAADASPLPSKMEALANLIEAQRYLGDEESVATLAQTMTELSTDLAHTMLTVGNVTATGLTPLKIHHALVNRARAMSALHDYANAFALYRKLIIVLPRKLASGRILFPESSTSESLVMTTFQLEHDREQLARLHAKGVLAGGTDALRLADAAYAAAANALEQYGTPLPGGAPGVVSVRYGELPSAVRGYLSAPLHVPDAMHTSWAGKPVLAHGRDWAAAESAYLRGEIVVLDAFLSAQALAELREIGAEATFWHESKQHGYLGAFMGLGFAPSIVAQLAIELERAMPTAFANNTLQEFWGYKYDPTHKSDSFGSAGINVHADHASVNVNFWITQDDANLDPDSGGMVVWSKLHSTSDNPEIKRRLARGDVSPEEKATFLGLRETDIQKVPYRANRAVIFRSSLYHKTDRHTFKPGFENCRINLTLLFGWQEDVRCRTAAAAAAA